MAALSAGEIATAAHLFFDFTATISVFEVSKPRCTDGDIALFWQGNTDHRLVLRRLALLLDPHAVHCGGAHPFTNGPARRVKTLRWPAVRCARPTAGSARRWRRKTARRIGAGRLPGCLYREQAIGVGCGEAQWYSDVVRARETSWKVCALSRLNRGCGIMFLSGPTHK